MAHPESGFQTTPGPG